MWYTRYTNSSNESHTKSWGHFHASTFRHWSHYVSRLSVHLSIHPFVCPSIQPSSCPSDAASHTPHVVLCKGKAAVTSSIHPLNRQERQGRWCIFDTGWSHWIDYLVKEDTMKVAWPGSNEIILVSGMKIVAKSQSDLWRLIMNSSAKFKADSISGVYAKIYHRIGTSNTNSAKDVH